MSVVHGRRWGVQCGAAFLFNLDAVNAAVDALRGQMQGEAALRRAYFQTFSVKNGAFN